MHDVVLAETVLTTTPVSDMILARRLDASLGASVVVDASSVVVTVPPEEVMGMNCVTVTVAAPEEVDVDLEVLEDLVFVFDLVEVVEEVEVADAEVVEEVVLLELFDDELVVPVTPHALKIDNAFASLVHVITYSTQTSTNAIKIQRNEVWIVGCGYMRRIYYCKYCDNNNNTKE